MQKIDIIHDDGTCERSLECLFGLGAVGKIKFLRMFRHVRAQVLSSAEETWLQNYLRQLVLYLNDATVRKIPAHGESTRSAIRTPIRNKKTFSDCLAGHIGNQAAICSSFFYVKVNK
ncbi:hypothetical protein TNCV_2066611 [Trichonephila clavipes]|uniref:Uncharacterized protein n=1 Tax=Trichonephila clavipes TaxID=2585209 RepID=A0A8X6W2V8_TRICX|nr:hypothetical protein TNCV_2066611 [Trichonephila clavipes]